MMPRSVFSHPTSIGVYEKQGGRWNGDVIVGMSNLAFLASCNGLAQWRNFRSNARKLPTKCGPNVHKSGRKSHKRILDIGRDPSVSAFSRDYRRRHNNPSFCHVGENINRHGDHRLEYSMSTITDINKISIYATQNFFHKSNLYVGS